MKSRDGRIWCRHFVGITKSGTCEEGITYKEQQWFGRGQDWPCHGGVGGCDKYESHTAEEIAKRDAAIQKTIAGFTVGRPAIVAKSVEMGFRKRNGSDVGKGVQGEINPCPVCKTGKLRFSRANGHVHAACTTESCCRWME